MKNYVSVFFVLIILLHTSCSKDSDTKQSGLAETEESAGDENSSLTTEKLSPADYVAWVNDTKNGLKVEKTIEAYTYSFQYRPLEYVALMDLRQESVKGPELKSKTEEYKDLQYFTFKILTDSQTELLKTNLKNENEYYGRIQYFSFDMQKDLKLIDGTDTLDCVLFHFERVFGLAPYATFNLGFQPSKNEGDKTLVYDERIFGAGKLYLKIRSKNIKKLPSVITQ